MRKAPFAIAAGGLAIVVAAMLAGRTALLPQPPARAPEQQAVESIGQAPAVVEKTMVADNAGRVRPVAPDVVAIPPVEPEELVRVEPREPLSPFGQPLPPPKLDNSRIHRPVADAAGRILGQSLLVAIAGIDIVEPGEVCTDLDGLEWPCGMRARTAFRGLLRGRTVSCDVPPDYEDTEITTTCSLGKLDLGGWIVANGWGRAAPGGPYQDQEQTAREAGKGIFGTGPLPPPVFATPLADALNGR